MRDLRLLPTDKPELPPGSRRTASERHRLALEDTPEAQRLDRLCEFFEALKFRFAAEPTYDPIEVDLTLQALPGVQLMSGRMQGVRYRRSSETTDDIGLIINPRGRQLVAQRGREVVLGAGDATLVSLTEPLETINGPPGDILALRIPLSLLGPRLEDTQAGVLRRIPNTIPALGLLTDYVNIAWQKQTLADPNLQRLLASHLSDLMALAVGATRDAAEIAQGRGLRAARLHAIKQDIARHLDQADLSVSALAVRHRLTPRFVQRLFETEGTTFTEYVLVQRLARAHRMLIDPRFDHEKISSVAYDCGFGDVSYFNRVFRRHYDAAPSDVRAQAGAARQPDVTTIAARRPRPTPP